MGGERPFSLPFSRDMGFYFKLNQKDFIKKFRGFWRELGGGRDFFFLLFNGKKVAGIRGGKKIGYFFSFFPPLS